MTDDNLQPPVTPQPPAIKFREPVPSSPNIFDFGAYLIAGSVLLGATLISASLFYNTDLIIKRLEAVSASAAVSAPANNYQNPPSAGTSAQPPGPAVAAPSPGTPVNINLKLGTRFLGSNKAKVTVVEFADYQCPFCEQFYKSVWPELKANYVDTGKIKFVYQDFAFLGADSNTAAEAAACAADQNNFWRFHDYLFNNQGQENSGWATADHEKEFARTLGLNSAKFNQCLDSHKYSQEVQDQTASGRGYGVTGTPTVFVNGKIIVGAEPYQNFADAIDAALK